MPITGRAFLLTQQSSRHCLISCVAILATAFNDIVGVCQSLHTSTATNSWAMTRFDRTYAHPYHLPNPIRQSGIVMSWHDHKTTQQGVYMSVIYIYLMTVSTQLELGTPFLTSVDSITSRLSTRSKIPGRSSLRNCSSSSAITFVFILR